MYNKVVIRGTYLWDGIRNACKYKRLSVIEVKRNSDLAFKTYVSVGQYAKLFRLV